MRTVHRSTTLAAAALLAVGALALGARPAAAQTSVSGVAYAQWMYTLANDTLKADSNITHINNFDITRAYINVNGSFAGGVKGRVTGDVYRVADGSLAYRLKYAFVSWTPEGSPLTIRFGQTFMPWIDWEESLNNYRMQGTMPMERAGYLTSSDFGLAVDGSFSHDLFNFQAGVYGGEKYNGALGDQRKDFAARASYRLLATDDGSRVGGLRVTGYAHVGAPTTGGQRNRFMGMVSYRSNDVTLAAEYGSITDSTTGGASAIGGGGVVAAAHQKKATLLSVYGVYHFPGTRFSLIGRADVLNTNTADTTVQSKSTRIIAGAAYQLSPNLRLLADVDLLGYKSGYVVNAGNYAAYVNRNVAYFQAMYSY
ncbi:MAG: hypothetical protein ABSB58_09880 [Gemmatimonadales bacterium]|jgi:hypothetical protein